MKSSIRPLRGTIGTKSMNIGQCSPTDGCGSGGSLHHRAVGEAVEGPICEYMKARYEQGPWRCPWQTERDLSCPVPGENAKEHERELYQPLG